MKKLKILQAYLEGLVQATSQERRSAAQSGNPSMERLLFGKQQAYNEILTTVNKLLEVKKK